MFSFSTTPVHASPTDERCLSRYWAIKHSWKGKYTRIVCINETSVETRDNDHGFRSTNKWVFGSTFVDATPRLPSVTEFTLSVKKNATSAPDAMTFSSEHRAHILSDIQQQRWRRGGCQIGECFTASKYTANESWRDVELHVTGFAILVLQRSSSNGGQDEEEGCERAPPQRFIRSVYYFTELAGIGRVHDNPRAVVLQTGEHGKLHLYVVDRVDEFLRKVHEVTSQVLGIPSNVLRALEPLTMPKFDKLRLGVSPDELGSVLEYSVVKGPTSMTRRTLCLTENYLLERDAVTYNTVTVHHLSDVLALIRCEDDAQKLLIQYRSTPRKVSVYFTTDRDSLLATILDSARSIGNINVVIRVEPVDLGRRVGSYSKRYPDVELSALKILAESAKDPEKAISPALVFEAVRNFNANVPHVLRDVNGAPDRLMHFAAVALLEGVDHKGVPDVALEQFYALHRVCSTRGGFQCPTVIPGFVGRIGQLIVRGIKMHHVVVTHAAIEFLTCLLAPQHEDYDIMQELANKQKILMSETFVSHITSMLNDHTLKNTGAVIVKSITDFLTTALCFPYSETTDVDHFDRISRLVATKCSVAIFRLLRHDCRSIAKNAGRILQVVLEEGGEAAVAGMQGNALTECAILLHFQQGAFSGDKNREQRDLARHLIGLYTTNNALAQDLLKRIVPTALLFFLQEKASHTTELPEHERMAITPEVRELSRLVKKKGFFGSGGTPAATEAALAAAAAAKMVAEPLASSVGTDGNPTTTAMTATTVNLNASMSSETKTGSPPPVPAAPRLRQRQVKLKSSLNWPWFFYQLSKDHHRPDLIWNHQTRHELKEAIEVELHAFIKGCEHHAKLQIQRDQENHGAHHKKSSSLSDAITIAWNHFEFEVVYPSLNKELRIGGQYFLRLLLESANSDSIPTIAKPRDFFMDLYHHFLLIPSETTSDETFALKLQGLQGMTLLYKLYADKVGAFADIGAILFMMDHTERIRLRDQIVLFLKEALRVKDNAKLMMDSIVSSPPGLNSTVLIDFLALVHLHSHQSILHNTHMAIEAGTTSQEGRSDFASTTTEWHYVNESGECVGPVTCRDMLKAVASLDKRKVWAQGIAGWMDPQRIQQLKTFDSDHGVLAARELTSAVLDIWLQVCVFFPNRSADGRQLVQPLPRVKRFLAQGAVLPHIVQLLLTFDSMIVTRVSTLLFHVLQDSTALPRVHSTGLFYFLLMYIGSDIKPMCRLLHLAHDAQAWSGEGSVLTPMLPTALVCFLRNYGADKFAEIFLGEYDTPEVIWSAKMRRHLVNKLAVHVAEFSPRLRSNTKAIYQFCPMVPPVEYEELQNELFVNMFYLRHLCDEIKFPEWPISNPISLLRDVLVEWAEQLKLQQESSGDKDGEWNEARCLDELELTAKAEKKSLEIGDYRKAYFRLAAIYHPDKNPDGREKFEAVQKAYEILAANTSSAYKSRNS
eukprot:PhM_4_TR16749/c0_g1_i2/m.79485/K09533/DNAJC13; DnaJ homolog subfamily C member 13